eukprot:201646_1
MASGGMIVCGLFWCISFVLCFILLSRALYDYSKRRNKSQTKSKKSIVLSLVTMSIFTFSLFLYSVEFIIWSVNGSKIFGLDLLNNLCYTVSLFTALYVWIRRLEETFQHSAHGYSVQYMRKLRILYFVTVAIGLLLMIEHIIVVILDATRIVSGIGAAIFGVFFISLFVGVLYSFINKMKESVRLSKQNTAHQTHSIANKLVQLVVKFTILSVLCVVSTLCSIVCVCLFLLVFKGRIPWHWQQMPLAIDDVLGFFSLYCAWSSNKNVYRKLFGCVHSTIIKYREESSIQSNRTGDIVSVSVEPDIQTVEAVRSQSITATSPDSASDLR